MVSKMGKGKQWGKWIKQLYLPTELRDDALLAGAHFGVDRVNFALGLKYCWRHMRQSIKNYIRSCDCCQRIPRAKSRLLIPFQ